MWNHSRELIHASVCRFVCSRCSEQAVCPRGGARVGGSHAATTSRGTTIAPSSKAKRRKSVPSAMEKALEVLRVEFYFYEIRNQKDLFFHNPSPAPPCVRVPPSQHAQLSAEPADGSPLAPPPPLAPPAARHRHPTHSTRVYREVAVGELRVILIPRNVSPIQPFQAIVPGTDSVSL
jgi:hypothetical protein